MVIREANNQDLEFISKLYWESDNHHYKNQPNIYSETKEPFRQKEYIKELINEDKSIFYVIVADNEVAGFIYGYEESKGFLPIHKQRTYFYIDNLVVAKKFQGKGYGRMLMDKLIKICKEKEYSDILLNVYSFNNNAISLYENLGFKELSKDMILEL